MWGNSFEFDRYNKGISVQKKLMMKCSDVESLLICFNTNCFQADYHKMLLICTCLRGIPVRQSTTRSHYHYLDTGHLNESTGLKYRLHPAHNHDTYMHQHFGNILHISSVHSNQ